MGRRHDILMHLHTRYRFASGVLVFDPVADSVVPDLLLQGRSFRFYFVGFATDGPQPYRCICPGFMPAAGTKRLSGLFRNSSD